jgi:hypothetical protein
MDLPFTETQFLDLFVAYHRTFGLAVVLLWIATLALVVPLLRGRSRSSVVSVVAAVHWAWSGIAYHAMFFTRINPAAWLFAALFVAQAAGFLWYGVAQSRLAYTWRRTPRHVLGAGLVAYSLAYPGLILLSGHEFPRAPAFAVPCPTTIFTAGLLLLTAEPVPLALLAVPIAWSLVGGSAAFLFGMTPDLMLFLAGASLAVYGVQSFRRTRTSRVDDDALVMRGDAFVPDPNYTTTLAINVNAGPEHIWPWLMQMGYQRGGLYSYDWLDRLFGFLDRPSADRILPEFQKLNAGDVVPIGRGAAFPVAVVEDRRTLVLAGSNDSMQWGWELALYPAGAQRTRLISRNRARVPASLGWTVFMWILAPAAFIMTRAMLRGLKRRAERLAAGERSDLVNAA